MASGSNAVPATGSCPVCTTGTLREFVALRDVPVHCNILWDTREGARTAPRGDLRLGFCNACGHVYNMAFDPSLMEYTQAYENSLHFSPRFQAYAEALADTLIERYGIRGKDVIDIGCGKGDFLAMLCLRGGNTGVGFDPSYVPEYTEATAASRMRILQDFYSPKFSGYSADLITCRHVLEHIQEPRAFVRNVRDAVGTRTEPVVFFEVPNVMYTLRDMGIWDLIYEHCSYFSLSSLATVFSKERFAPCGRQSLYGDQFLGIEVRPANAAVEVDVTAEVKAIQSDVDAFAANYESKVRHWKETFDRLRSEGKRAAVWGGGSKGVTFLNTLKPGDVVSCMVDINPRKQGMFVAGTGYDVVGPEFLRTHPVDTIIIMNPIYKDEITASVRQLGITAAIVVA